MFQLAQVTMSMH